MSRERTRYAMLFLAEPDKVGRYGSLLRILLPEIDPEYAAIGAEMVYIETHRCLPPWGMYVDGFTVTTCGTNFRLDAYFNESPPL
jgi:hypothetical protein